MSRIVLELPSWVVVGFLVVFAIQVALDGRTAYWEWRRERARREWAERP